MYYSIDECKNLERVIALSEALGYPKADDYFERSQQNMDKGERVPLVVCVHGQDVGYCFLNRKPRYRLYERLGIYEIQDLNVLPAHRGKGYAGALVEYCEKLAKGEGCSDIGISVGLTKDYGPAQRLYCKLGYRPDGNGITYDRAPLSHGDRVVLDDDLCLMMVKALF